MTDADADLAQYNIQTYAANGVKTNHYSTSTEAYVRDMLRAHLADAEIVALRVLRLCRDRADWQMLEGVPATASGRMSWVPFRSHMARTFSRPKASESAP